MTTWINERLAQRIEIRPDETAENPRHHFGLGTFYALRDRRWSLGDVRVNVDDFDELREKQLEEPDTICLDVLCHEHDRISLSLVETGVEGVEAERRGKIIGLLVVTAEEVERSGIDQAGIEPVLRTQLAAYTAWLNGEARIATLSKDGTRCRQCGKWDWKETETFGPYYGEDDDAVLNAMEIAASEEAAVAAGWTRQDGGN